MSEGTARTREKIDPRTDFLAAAEWIISHYIHKDPRMENLRGLFLLFGEGNGDGVSIQDVERRLSVSPSTASHTLRRAVEISNIHSHAFPLIVSRTEVPDPSIPIGKRSVYRASLNPDALLLNIHLGHTVRNDEKLRLDLDHMRTRLARVLNSTTTPVSKRDVLLQAPETAEAIISNASWCFREERGDLESLRTLAANRSEGYATNITALQQRLGIKIQDGSTYGCVLERMSFANAFKCGIVVIQATDLPTGFYSIEFLSERCRRRALKYHYGPGGLEKGQDSPFYFDTEAADFNPENFRERMKAVKEGRVSTMDPQASDAIQLAIFKYVARQNAKGIYPSCAAVAKAASVAKRTVGRRVRMSKEARHDLSMYIRDRNSRGGFECKLLEKVRGA